MSCVLAVDQVSVSYGRTPALSAISFELRPGEVVCLAGRNGAGKSTLLRAMAGLEPKASGRVRVDGEPVTSPHGRSSVALLTNPPPLYPYLTAREHAALLCDLWALPARDADAMLAAHDLDALAGRTPEEMSLGQRQRLAFALLDLPQPRIWLLDEPFNGLDAQAGDALIDRLRAQQLAGRSAIVATHLVEVIEPVATRLLWLAEGTIVCDEPIDSPLVERCEALMAVREETTA